MADNIRATPRNELLGLLSDAMSGGLNWMRDPQRTQQMQGLAGLLESTGIPKTTERMAYGEDLTNINRANVPLLKPETADALMNVAPLAPVAGRVASRTGRAVGRMAGEEINAAMTGQPTSSLLGQLTPRPLRMTDTSYRGQHTAPSPEFGAPLHDLTGGGQMYPADVYSEKAAQYYGSGNRKADTEAFNLAKRVRGNPDAEVTMYRAVPKNADITNINAGDWVTLSKEYAKNHGESVLGNDYKILSQKVKAKELWTNADSIQEFGYQPQQLNAPQQAALDLAQQRAALPVEQGGLGLPPNNTPEMRAQAMGFGADFAHGSPQSNITRFEPSKTGEMGSGIYATNYFPEADIYAGKEIGATTYPLKVKTNTAYQAGEENPYMKLIVSDDEQLQKALQRMGKESIIKTQQPPPDWLKALGTMDMPIREHFVSMNPDLFRSRFAAFDPFRKDVATATAMGVALPDLLAAELPEEELKRNQSAGLLFP